MNNNSLVVIGSRNCPSDGKPSPVQEPKAWQWLRYAFTSTGVVFCIISESSQDTWDQVHYVSVAAVCALIQLALEYGYYRPKDKKAREEREKDPSFIPLEPSVFNQQRLRSLRKSVPATLLITLATSLIAYFWHPLVVLAAFASFFFVLRLAEYICRSIRG